MTEKRNGCHNREPMRPFVESRHLVMVNVSLNAEISSKMVQEVVAKTPFRNSTDCQYTLSDLGQGDKGCDGCKWRHRGAP